MNSANENDRLVAEYLERLTRALQDLPRDRRDSIIEDIREHIRTARAGMASEDEAQIRQLLEDLGSPQAIRAEAGLPPHSRAGWGDILAPWLLLLGGFVFVVGWLVGVVLLWNSSIWSTRDKLLATVIWPGGLAGVLYGFGLVLAVQGSTTSTCIGGPGIASNCPPPPSPSTLHVILGILSLVVAVVAPIVVHVRLTRIQRRWAEG